VRVDAEREPRVGVAEVLGDGLHRLAGVDQHGRVEVPERVHAVLAGRLDAGDLEGGLPDVPVEVRPVDRVVLPCVEEEPALADGEALEMVGQRPGDVIR
jgi:hypothetical protein